VLDAWLHEAHRTLQPQQHHEVLTKFRGCPYIRLRSDHFR